MAVVADIANAIRDGKIGTVTGDLLRRQERLDGEISSRVGMLVDAQRTRMTRLRESVAAANRRALILNSVFGVAAIVLALFCGFVISWSFILPVREAQTFLDQVSAGKFGGRVSVPNRDEFGLLAERMNHMAGELERFDKEQRHAAAELARLNDQLGQASKAKSEFLANMSHELRTPMNAVLGYTDLILDDIFGEVPAPIRETLERVKTNGQHLLGLINDVLDLSKMEAGQLTLSLGEYAMADVVHTVVAAVESLAAGKKLALKTVVPADLPAGRGDERRLTQVLLNLTGNAIKFTDAGEVSIEARAANESFVVSVSDTGPGISEADQQKIFEEFQQADTSSTRVKGGTGLGLSISRRIVELHGGRLWVESVPGEGSTFLFTVPLVVERHAEKA
jgi:signal transduction histidine kinase